jgi:hypothetical protein
LWFNNTVSNSDYIASNYRKINEQRIEKDVEGYYPAFAKESYEKPLNSQSLSHNLNSGEFQTLHTKKMPQSDYGLDDRGSIPDRGRGFFF